MKEMRFSIDIKASKDQVWNTLWEDETFREWAGIIDPGTYMVGDLQEGNEVQFISEENGYGVTSFIEALIPHEFLLLKHRADTQETGTRERKDEWTGGAESYVLKEKDAITTLAVAFDVPIKMEHYFAAAYPKALECIKVLSEKDSE